MDIVRCSHEIPSPIVATIGMFDGVHLGHRFLIDDVIAMARRRGMPSAVVTFAQHPRRVLCPDADVALLTTFDERMQLLGLCGVDYAIVMDFTVEFSRQSACEFLRLLHCEFYVETLLVGHDHRFGHNRSDDFSDYCTCGRELGMEIVKALPYQCNDGIVSSSSIRKLLLEGDVSRANLLLGYRYALQGRVVEGYRLGRELGFPTANIALSNSEKLLPAMGVYAVVVHTDDGGRYKGMMNVGQRPTVSGDENLSVEVHLFDFSGNLYDSMLTIELVAFMRREQKYDSVKCLREHLQIDEQQARYLLDKAGV